MQPDREAAPVVLYCDAAVFVQRHVNLMAEPRQGFVHAVIHDFIDQMMQPPHIRGADIHARPLPYGLQSLKYLDLFLSVVRCNRHFTFQIHFRIPFQFFSHVFLPALSAARLSPLFCPPGLSFPVSFPGLL